MDLHECRKEINRIDDSILELLVERRAVVRRVIETKLGQNMPLRDELREAELLDRLIRSGRKRGLDVHFVTRVFHEVIEDSVRSQEAFLQKSLNPTPDRPLSIAFQGVAGAYSHLAGEKFFADRIERCAFEGYKTFADVAAAVENGQADYAILPIENTTAGSINAVYDLLLSTKLSIIGEEVFSVNHCLLAPEKVPISSIRRVLSHYQALAQCSEFLARLKNCEQETYVDTAEAAKRVAEDGDPSQAAIASEEAGRIYGLQVLKRNLANQKENYTRFVVAADRPSQVDPRVPCKTSLVLSTPHREGALLQALAVLHEYGINLTKLESRPMQGSPFAYIFYVDFEGNANDPTVQEALVRLSGATSYLRVLGTYPRERHDRTRPWIQSKVPEPAVAAPATPSAAVPGEPAPAERPTGRGSGLASRETKAEDTRIRVRDVEFGDSDLIVIAGPAAARSAGEIRAAARHVSECGGAVLRGACLEPRVSAYTSRRVQHDLLEALVAAARDFGLLVVVEVESVADVALAARSADILEVGSRNMLNFSLLEEAGKTGRPVLLARSTAASLDEFLDAAECILAQGNQQVMLCERGTRSGAASSRTVLDLGSISELRRITHLPVVVDPSLAVDRAELVLPLLSAARSFGAQSVLVTLEPQEAGEPKLEAPVAAPLALSFAEFGQLMSELYR